MIYDNIWCIFQLFHDFADCWMHPLNSSFRQRGPGHEKGLQDFCSWRPFDSGHCEFGFVLSFVNLRRSNGHRKIAHYEAGRSELWVLLLRDTSDFSRAAASKKVIWNFKECLLVRCPACMLTWLAWQCAGCGPSHLLRIATSKIVADHVPILPPLWQKGHKARNDNSWWLHTMNQCSAFPKSLVLVHMVLVPRVQS